MTTYGRMGGHVLNTNCIY